MKPFNLFLIVVFVSIFSCKSDRNKDKNTMTEAERIAFTQSLSEYKWLLTELNGRPISTLGEIKIQPYIQFGEESNQINGYAGCNQFTGTYTLRPGNAIEFSHMASTLKACPDMDLETMLFEVLESADEWRIHQGELLLGKSAYSPVMRFKPEISFDVHSSMNSLDWEGVYKGVLPCDDCEGISTVIYLRKDQSFTIESQYLGKTDEILKRDGLFSWSEDGSTVVFRADSVMSPTQYLVGEHYLKQIDMNGKKMNDELRDQYILHKIDQGINEKYWKLIELNGEPIVWMEDFRHEPHLIFKEMDGRVTGHGGCNTLNGSYAISDGNHITFSRIGSTKIGCPDMSVENELFRLLEKVDHFSLSSDTLSLQQSKMDPLARFVAIYLR